MTIKSIWLWLFIPLVVAIALVLSPAAKYKRFFSRTGFRGYDGKLPRYLGKKRISDYVVKARFKSRIPIECWDSILPLMEQAQKKRIHKVEQAHNKIGKTDVFYIKEELPRCIIWNETYQEEKENYFSIGEGYQGRAVWNIASFPHGIVAGATGGGKTALLRCIIHQAISKKFNVTVMDFKSGGDFSDVEEEAHRAYGDLENGYGPFLITEPAEANQLLLCLLVEVKGRLQRFKERGVTNIYEYNALGDDRFLPWLLVIDEAAELLDVKPADKAEKELYAEINHSLRTLARISRAAGVHILMGFIRPDANVLDGQIKNNLLWRVCGYFADPTASRIVLDNDKATEIPPEIKGRFIIGEDEVQAYYLPPISPKTEDEK